MIALVSILLWVLIIIGGRMILYSPGWHWLEIFP
jgi:hypothetical protein